MPMSPTELFDLIVGYGLAIIVGVGLVLLVGAIVIGIVREFFG